MREVVLTTERGHVVIDQIKTGTVFMARKMCVHRVAQLSESKSVRLFFLLPIKMNGFPFFQNGILFQPLRHRLYLIHSLMVEKSPIKHVPPE